MKLCIIVGTRPEIIKMSRIIELMENSKDHEYFIIHTNQHYSASLDKIFFEELQIPSPDYNLNVGSGTHAIQTAKMLQGIEKFLKEEKPDHILVHGDTNTTLSGALTGVKLNQPVAHIEAGLRSNDKKMPEEINRIICDHISDYLFAPAESQKQNLLNEGVIEDNIYVVGNTIVDAIQRNVKFQNNKILEDLGISERNYSLLTLHRAENVDDQSRLKQIFQGINYIIEKHDEIIVFPIHPRTKKRLIEFQIDLHPKMVVIEPLGYLDFIALMNNSRTILTDSGGIQEEATILQIPCITIRNNTERPESVEVGANIIAGVDSNSILNAYHLSKNKKRSWENPFGDGNSSESILRIMGYL